jgi:hypothetical protein
MKMKMKTKKDLADVFNVMIFERLAACEDAHNAALTQAEYIVKPNFLQGKCIKSFITPITKQFITWAVSTLVDFTKGLHDAYNVANISYIICVLLSLAKAESKSLLYNGLEDYLYKALFGCVCDYLTPSILILYAR